MTIDRFASKAATYDDNPQRVDNVDSIAQGIRQLIPLDRSWHLMDFGAGTGLLLARVAPHVAKITAVDVSTSMLAQLRAKQDSLGCELELVRADLEQADLPLQVDGIISSMTLHHIRDVPALLGKFHRLVKPGGFIALADLDTEDGSFHTEDTGVYHLGFDRAELAATARRTGFQAVQVVSASVVHKPQRDYPVFLLTGRR